MAKKTKTQAPVSSSQTVGEAFEAILRHNLESAIQWEPVARSRDDIEGVHQMRVSFRRLRSALSAFRAAVPREVTKGWSEDIRWLGGQMGLARDLDVFIDEGLGGVRDKLALPGREKLTGRAVGYRDKSYETVRAMLESDRYARFKKEFTAWVDARGWQQAELKDKQRRRLQSPVPPFARRLLDRLERQVLEAGSHVDTESQAEMHRLRIQCKKLRYAAEFFVPVLKGLNSFIGHMKGLQDLLGAMNDVYVMRHLLDELLEEETDPTVFQYAGGLVGWRTCQYRRDLAGFDDRWEEFVHAKHPWWSKHGEME